MNPTYPQATIRTVCLGLLNPEQYEERDINLPFVPSTYAELQLCVRDFLRELRCHIERYMEDAVDGIPWRYANVEYLFPENPRWNPDVTKDFQKLAREAGFGSTGRSHTVTIGLTNYEAFVSYVLITNMVSCVVRINPDLG